MHIGVLVLSVMICLICGRSKGEKSGGTRLSLMGWSAGRQILNKKSKTPLAVMMPTSPMSTPFFRYCSGRFRWGVGAQRGKPRLLANRLLTYTSASPWTICADVMLAFWNINGWINNAMLKAHVEPGTYGIEGLGADWIWQWYLSFCLAGSCGGAVEVDITACYIVECGTSDIGVICTREICWSKGSVLVCYCRTR